MIDGQMTLLSNFFARGKKPKDMGGMTWAALQALWEENFKLRGQVKRFGNENFTPLSDHTGLAHHVGDMALELRCLQERVAALEQRTAAHL